MNSFSISFFKEFFEVKKTLRIHHLNEIFEMHQIPFILFLALSFVICLHLLFLEVLLSIDHFLKGVDVCEVIILRKVYFYLTLDVSFEMDYRFCLWIFGLGIMLSSLISQVSLIYIFSPGLRPSGWAWWLLWLLLILTFRRELLFKLKDFHSI